MGQTIGGRYVTVILQEQGAEAYTLVTARDATREERPPSGTARSVKLAGKKVAKPLVFTYSLEIEPRTLDAVSRRARTEGVTTCELIKRWINEGLAKDR